MILLFVIVQRQNWKLESSFWYLSFTIKKKKNPNALSAYCSQVCAVFQPECSLVICFFTFCLFFCKTSIYNFTFDFLLKLQKKWFYFVFLNKDVGVECTYPWRMRHLLQNETIMHFTGVLATQMATVAAASHFHHSALCLCMLHFQLLERLAVFLVYTMY